MSDNKLDFSMFEDELNEELDTSMFSDEEIQPQELIEDTEPSQLEAAVRGGAQGLTLGFADELVGGAEALGSLPEALKEENTLQSLLERYRQGRDESRVAFEAAQEAHPGTYLAGEVAGGVLPALGTGGVGAMAKAGQVGLKEAIKSGTRIGAAGGLGVSEADLTEGELGEATKDVAIGAATGGALGGIAAGAKGTVDAVGNIKQTLGKVADFVSPSGKKAFMSGYKSGLQGKQIFTDEYADDLAKQMSQLTDDTRGIIKNNLEVGNTMKTGVFDKAGKYTNNTSLKKTLADLKTDANKLPDLVETDAVQKNNFLNELRFIEESLKEKGAVGYDDLERASSHFYSLMSRSSDPKLIGATKNAYAQFKTLIKEGLQEIDSNRGTKLAEGYLDANSLSHHNMNAARLLNEKLLERLDKVRGQKAKRSLEEMFKKLGKTGTSSGDKAKNIIEDAVAEIRDITSKLDAEGAKGIDDIVNKIRVVAEDMQQNREITGDAVFNVFGTVRSQAMRSGYYGGLAQKNLKELAKDLASAPIEAAVGRANTQKFVTDPIKRVVSGIKTMSNTNLGTIASKARTKGYEKSANFLDNLSKLDNKKRSATVFSAMQNPSLRQELQELFKDED